MLSCCCWVVYIESEARLPMWHCRLFLRSQEKKVMDQRMKSIKTRSEGWIENTACVNVKAQ